MELLLEHGILQYKQGWHNLALSSEKPGSETGAERRHRDISENRRHQGNVKPFRMTQWGRLSVPAKLCVVQDSAWEEFLDVIKII